MAVVALQINNRGPYANGRAFGEVGAYERIDAIVEYAVDPANEANHQIIDLDLVQKAADGLVHFTGDLTLIKPVDDAKGNGRLLTDVVNRGRNRVVPTFNLVDPSNPGPGDIPAGDGFLFELGWTVACVGWQWDVYRSSTLMALDAPIASVRGQVLVEINPDRIEHTRLLANRIHKPHKAANLNDPDAVLYVKDWEDGPYEKIARDRWRFAKETGSGVEPSNEHIYFESGFERGRIYHLVYTAEGSPVTGCGLISLRDTGAFFRESSDLNPIVGGLERAYIYGVSQTGRMLRHFLYLGLNKDEIGRQVYDGMLPHVAGGRRGEFNMRFAQPSGQSTPGFGHMFPFADDDLPDPMGGTIDGLLRRERAQGTAPKIIYTNTSAEYWRGDGSLSHTDPSGERDLDVTLETRTYLFAGTQHADSRGLPQPGEPGIDGTFRRYPSNIIDYRPLQRAALVNLDAWVSHGIEPPPSLRPRIDDGTAVSRADALKGLGVVPNLAQPDPDRLWMLRETDPGSNASVGQASLPVKEGRAYDCRVSAVDTDGNEVAGIRLPEIAVPVATHSGWNPRDPEAGAPEQIIPMVGFTLFFARDAAERKAKEDPRPSIVERYGNREAYLELARLQAEKLAAQRYLRAEDVEVVVTNAGRVYDSALQA
jgi:hypothetical protein